MAIEGLGTLLAPGQTAWGKRKLSHLSHCPRAKKLPPLDMRSTVQLTRKSTRGMSGAWHDPQRVGQRFLNACQARSYRRKTGSKEKRKGSSWPRTAPPR